MSVRTLLTSAVTGFAGGTYWILKNKYPAWFIDRITIDTSDNIYYPVGTAISPNQPLIVKVNTSGIVQWANKLEHSDALPVINYNSSNSNIYLDYQNTVSSGETIIRISTSGTIQNQVLFNYSKQAVDMGTDSSGNFYIVGVDGADAGGNVRQAVIKYNSSSAIQWVRALNNGSTDDIYLGNIAVDSSGNSHAIGVNYNSSGYTYANIFKLNTSGTLQWQRRLGSTTVSFTNHDIGIDSSSNVYVASGISDGTLGADYLHVVKYNSSGTLQWQRRFTDFGINAVKCAVDSSGNVNILGLSTSTANLVIIRYNTSGTLQWQKELDITNVTFSPTDIKVNTAGDIVISTYIYYDLLYTFDSLIIKLPADGSISGTFGEYVISDTSNTSSTASDTSTTPTLTFSTGTTDTSSSASEVLSTSSITTIGTVLS